MAVFERFLRMVTPVGCLRPDWKRFHAQTAGCARTSGGPSLEAICSSMDVNFSRESRERQFLVSEQIGPRRCVHQHSVFDMQKRFAPDQGAGAVRDNKGGAPLDETFEGLDNCGFGLDINGAGGLVENQDRRILQKSTREGDALA